MSENPKVRVSKTFRTSETFLMITDDDGDDAYGYAMCTRKLV